MKDCLSCLYEPEWGPPTGTEYPRRFGRCRWNKPIPKLPKVFILRNEGITRYSDDSGVAQNCQAWEPKTPNERNHGLPIGSPVD